MASKPPGGNRTQNITVKVKVDGDIRAINSLARLEAAQAKLLTAQNRAAGSLGRFTQQNQEATKAQRQSTQAGIQASQQIQDFTVQIQGGQRPLVAFTQQASQLAFVMSGVQGRVGAVARFLAGPWGSAVFIALAVLGPFVEKLFESGDAADEAADKQYDFTRALDFAALSTKDYQSAIEQLDASIKNAIGTQKAYAAQLILNARLNLAFSRSRQSAAKAELDRQKDFSGSFVGSLAKPAFGIFGGETASEARARKDLADATKDLAVANRLVAESEIAQAQEEYAASTDKAFAATRKFDQALADLNRRRTETASLESTNDVLGEVQGGRISIDEYSAAYAKLSVEREKASEKADKSSAAARKEKQSLSEAAKEAERYAERLNDLYEAYRAGGPDAQKAAEQLKLLNDVVAKIAASEGVDGGDILSAEKYRALATAVIEAEMAVRAFGDEFEALNVEFEKTERAQDALTRKLELVTILMEEQASGPYLEWLKEQARTIEEQLNPAWKAAREAAENYAKSVTSVAESYAFGSPEIEKSKKELFLLSEALKQLEAQNYGGQYNQGIARLKEEIQKTEFELAKLNLTALESQGLDLALNTIDGIASAFGDAITGAQSFADAMEQVARQVVAELTKIIVKMALISLFNAAFGLNMAGGFAKGGVIDKGKATPFARGGVVSQPTFFPMRSGMGLMGEAGPEAIMPLRRTGNGDLGVKSTAPVVNVQVINNSGSSVSVDDDGAGNIAIVVEQAKRAVAADIRRGDGDVSKSMQSAYGLGRARR